jgi:diguanylate cyclase (GGDEF)-like protein
MPYFVVAFAGVVVAFSFIIRHELNPTALALGWFVSMVVLARQVFILKEDNDRLNDLTAAQLQLIYRAEHDTLTGIANRSCFDRHLAQALSASQNDSEPLAVFFIDVDNFKSINDRYGHVAGDELLALLAARLKRCVRDGDIVARIGGDEFALLLRRAAMSASVSKRILDAVQQPYRLRAGLVVASVSVGLMDLRGAQGELSAEDLMERVDTAMYEAKKLRGSTLVMVDADRLTAHQTLRGA